MCAAAGSQLQEKQLCERYGVSKSPIRDAMLKLEELSLVEIMPRKGYRVRPISLADARELYDLRLMLERECISKAIEVASDATLAALDRFRDVDGTMPLAEWIDYNREFHGAVADASGNARLARMTRQVLDQFDRLTHMSVSQSGPEGARASSPSTAASSTRCSARPAPGAGARPRTRRRLPPPGVRRARRPFDRALTRTTLR